MDILFEPLDKPILDAEECSLSEWLRLLGEHPDEREHYFCDYKFPTDQHREEYIASIADRSDRDVKDLLRNFLILGGTLGCDRMTLYGMREFGTLARGVEAFEHVKRLLNPERQTWEGNTWILDLLPYSPQLAIDSLHGYIAAHGQFLPDGRWDGMVDAIEVIRARYLEAEHPQTTLLRLGSREFEILVAALYKEMGYTVEVTPPVRDGGFDIRAEKREGPGNEVLLIECKRYTDNVRVEKIRALDGVVSTARATKGVLVTTSGFTGPARKLAGQSSRTELVDYPELNRRLNKFFGSDWPDHIDRYIATMQREVDAQNQWTLAS